MQTVYPEAVDCSTIAKASFVLEQLIFCHSARSFQECRCTLRVHPITISAMSTFLLASFSWVTCSTSCDQNKYDPSFIKSLTIFLASAKTIILSIFINSSLSSSQTSNAFIPEFSRRSLGLTLTL